MGESEVLLIKLQDLSQFLASGNLDDDLTKQSAMAAKLVGAETCSIMLIDDGEGEHLRMSVCASFGPLSPAAWTASIGKGEGIAGNVLATGKSLLVEDILHSQFSHLARRADDPRRSLMSSPISIEAKIIGIVNVCGAQSKPTFSQVDLHMLEVIAMFIGKSIQVIQLQNILNSRFTQLALMQDLKEKVDGSIATAYQHPDQVARILAKSLFKEMTKAGFGSGQIIHAASEIISQLNNNLKRHSERVIRHDEGAKPQ